MLRRALRRIRGERSFVVTRSSYPGLGHYAFHWTGDISSNWDDLSYSIPGQYQLTFDALFPVVTCDDKKLIPIDLTSELNG